MVFQVYKKKIYIYKTIIPHGDCSKIGAASKYVLDIAIFARNTCTVYIGKIIRFSSNLDWKNEFVKIWKKDIL